MVVVFVVFLYYNWYNDRDLWDWYYYLPLYEAIDIWYPEKTALIYKSRRMYLFSNIKITWDIINVKYNDDFIVFSKKMEDNLFKCFIIDKKSNQILGPFTTYDFVSYARRLNVSLNCEI